MRQFLSLPKLIAYAAALVFAFAVASLEARVASFPGELPIEIVGLGEGLAATAELPAVRIKIIAPPRTLPLLSQESFEASVDLSKLGVGTHDVAVAVRSKQDDVRVIEWRPARVVVRIEPEIARQLPIRAVFDGEAAEGLVPGDVRIDPEVATVRGPESDISRQSEILARILLSGERDQGRRKVPLSLPEANPRLKVSPLEAEVTFSLVRSSRVVTVGIKVKTVGRPRGGYFVEAIETEPASLAVVSQTAPRGTMFVETVAVDLSGADRSLEREVDLVVPAGLKLVDEQGRVRVRITIAPLPGEREIALVITFRTAPGLRVSDTSPKTFRALVAGPQERLSRLRESELSLFLDLANRAAGNHQVDLAPAMVAAPEGISVLSLLPSSVSVSLSS